MMGAESGGSGGGSGDGGPGGVAEDLKQRLERRDATVGVIGLGYVGLPLAVAFAKAGMPVIGVDADAERAALIGRGQSPIEDVPSDELAPLVRTGRLTVAEGVGALGGTDAIIICVPTPLGKSKEPDISHIVAAADEVARILRPGQLVVLESTTYPGTTEEVLLPRFAASGLAVGKQLFLAFSPERIDPGNRTYALANIPKIVGGVTPACRELACALYGQIVERVVPVSSPQAAEMVKLFENIFRSVNIALVNELAIMCRRLGLSVWEIIDAAATKPFGFMPFYPGPGIGGHCLPSDPYYLSWRARMLGYEARFIAFADEINGGMPAYTVQLAADALNDQGKPLKGSRILALGVAYKPGVGDVRDSPAVEIIDALLLRGARVDYTDPHVPVLAVGNRRLTGVDWAAADLASYDLVAVLTAHREFDPARLCREARLIIDTRNLTGPLGAQPHVIRL
jgi:UDP-N-acetyl-D-glucosamine dehydrogenase